MGASQSLFEYIVPVTVQFSLLQLPVVAQHFSPIVEVTSLQTFFSPEEIKRLQGFSFPKRKLEWLGGRLAVKYCLQAYQSQLSGFSDCLVEPAIYAVANDDHGRPYLVDKKSFAGRLPSLSISHSKDYAVALVSPSFSCGIDIQYISERLQALQERFASREEVNLGNACRLEVVSWLAMLWACKEAIKKCWYADQPTFMDRVHVSGLQMINKEKQWVEVQCNMENLPGKKAVVQACLYKDYALAFCVEDKDA